MKLGRIGRWFSDHFWGAARLNAAGDSVLQLGGRDNLVEDLAVGGTRTQFPVEDDIIKPLLDQRRAERATEDEAPRDH